MDPNMRENGSVTKEMVMELKFMKMEINIKDILEWT